MKIVEWKQLTVTAPLTDATVTIGVFDAFHRGHQTLAAAAFAESEGEVRVVVTFRTLPKGKGHPVYPFSERIKDLAVCGFDEAVVIDFDDCFAALSAAEFFDKLKCRYRIRRLTVGADFRCGAARRTPASELKVLLPEAIVQTVMLTDGTEAKISASDIKSFLKKGDPRSANVFLMHPYRLPMRWWFAKTGIRRRSGLTVLPDGDYLAAVGEQHFRAVLKGAFIKSDRKLLVKKPIEIIILSKYKE